VLETAANGPRATLTAVLAKRRGAKQKPRELAGLVKLVRAQRPKTVLEIGTLHGGTLWAWCRAASPEATIVSVDLPGGEFGGGYNDALAHRLRTYPRSSQVLHLLRADSHSPKTLAEVKRLLPGPVEFAFIDGDHTYRGVKQDFEMYSPLVAPGGLVAFHDTLPHNADTECGVDLLWAELSRLYETVEFADPSDVRWNGVWGGIGVLRMPQVRGYRPRSRLAHRSQSV
jgi:predicted O-methyltransferase YrrM